MWAGPPPPPPLVHRCFCACNPPPQNNLTTLAHTLHLRQCITQPPTPPQCIASDQPLKKHCSTVCGLHPPTTTTTHTHTHTHARTPNPTDWPKHRTMVGCTPLCGKHRNRVPPRSPPWTCSPATRPSPSNAASGRLYRTDPSTGNDVHTSAMQIQPVLCGTPKTMWVQSTVQLWVYRPGNTPPPPHPTSLALACGPSRPRFTNESPCGDCPVTTGPSILLTRSAHAIL
jgi:hypothetical protein